MEFIRTTANNINLNIVKTSKFKTTRIQMSFVGDLDEKTVTTRAVLPYILKTVSQKYPDVDIMQKQLEEMYAASLNVGINKISDAHIITFDLMTIDNQYTIDNEDLIDSALDLLQEVVCNPYFKADIITNEKRLLEEYYQGIYANKMKFALQGLIKDMFKNEKFHINHLGKQEDLEFVTEETLQDEYNKMMTDNHVFFTVVGNVDVDKMKKRITDRFEFDNKKQIPDLISNEDKVIDEVNIIKVEQDVQQAKLVCGYRFDVKYREEDYFAAIVFNLLFGGSTESLLFQDIREKLGLVYFVNSSYNPYKGALFVYAGIDQEDRNKVYKEIKLIIERIQKGEFDEGLIDIMKKSFTNGVIQGMDSQFSLTGKISQSYLFDFDYSVETTLENINSVTKEDVMKVAQKLRQDTIYLLRGRENE